MQALDGQAVLLEDGDGGGHFADLVLTAGIGHIRVEIAVGDFIDGGRYALDRPAEMIGADVNAHADACRNADAGNGKHEPEQRSTEGFDLGIDGLQLGLVDLYDRIDLGLEGLSVRPVGFIVALGVGGSGPTSVPRRAVSVRKVRNSLARSTSFPKLSFWLSGTSGAHPAMTLSISSRSAISPLAKLPVSLISFAA
ncbi:hypothetical protein AJ87_04610 [Rhizobium yanglingense]|nr:hypothetical protein AJ87_04610 [Rhizobium yanglingense]